MCVETKAQKSKDDLTFITENAKLKLMINILPRAEATKSYATVRWVEKISEHIFYSYRFGVEYDQIESEEQKTIERYALWLYIRPMVRWGVAVVLFVVFIMLLYIGILLR